MSELEYPYYVASSPTEYDNMLYRISKIRNGFLVHGITSSICPTSYSEESEYVDCDDYWRKDYDKSSQKSYESEFIKLIERVNNHIV